MKTQVLMLFGSYKQKNMYGFSACLPTTSLPKPSNKHSECIMKFGIPLLASAY